MPKYTIVVRKYAEVFETIDIEADNPDLAMRKAEVQAQDIKFPDAGPAKFQAEGYTIS